MRAAIGALISDISGFSGPHVALLTFRGYLVFRDPQNRKNPEIPDTLLEIRRDVRG